MNITHTRTRMGNVHPCLDGAAAIALRGGSENAWKADLTCDIWPAPHVANPFILYCMTQWWPVVFLLTGVNELVESLGRVLNGGSTVPLLELIEGGESLTEALVDDWLICGGIGLILGGLFMYHIRYYPLLSLRAWRFKRGAFFFYLGFTIVWILPYTVNAVLSIPTPAGVTGVASFSTDKAELYIGPPFTVLAHAAVAIIALWLEPSFSNAWVGTPHWKRSTFWVGMWALTALLEIQATWDWLYSGAIQVYLLSFLLAMYMLVIAFYRGQLRYFGERFMSWSYVGKIDRITEAGFHTDPLHPSPHPHPRQLATWE